MSLITYDIQQLYQRTFGTKPVVPANDASYGDGGGQVYLGVEKPDDKFTPRGRTLYETYRGTEVWLPVTLRVAYGLAFKPLYLPYSVVRATCKKNIISTPLAERQGTVKELYSVDDWQITVKGFLIATEHTWPEKEIEDLNEYYKKSHSLIIQNALTDVLLENQSRPEEQCRVVMESLEFMEIEGGRIRAQAFSMKLVGDSVFTLEVK